MTALETTIIVAGAGPVGMSLAIEAALRGVDVVVIEARQAGEPPSAKCNTIAARTMEIFRRFGVAEAIRNSGLPDDYPTDTIYCSSLSGPEFTRIGMPSRNERAKPGFDDSDWLTPEPMVRVSQLYLEPILEKRLHDFPNVRVINRTKVEGFTQTENGVIANCVPNQGEPFTVAGRFLVGCDGGRSTIRKQLGITLSGDAVIGRTRSTLIRAPGLGKLFGARRPAWMSWVVNHKARGNVVAIDGKDVWLVHRAMPNAKMPFEALDFDQSIRDVLGVGPEFTWEVINHEDWIGRRLVADRFRDGNVFIAGDAAHLWVPFAGYGMNAGIADAMNLAWVLCSVAKGWASPNLLDAYESERQPITEQVSRHAIQKVMENVQAMGSGTPPVALSKRGLVGAILRGVIGRKLYRINVPQFAPAGLNFGYYYEGSPIIAYDGEAPPSYTMGDATPSTVPGCRLPHVWLGAGVSIYDRLGPDYTLIRFDPAVDVAPLVTAATAAGVPMVVLDVAQPKTPDVFRHKLLIVRQDQHIAWRGNATPADATQLMRLLRGDQAVESARAKAA